jgi:hypothetical protein
MESNNSYPSKLIRPSGLRNGRAVRSSEFQVDRDGLFQLFHDVWLRGLAGKVRLMVFSGR